MESISSRWRVTGEELKSIKQHPDGFSILYVAAVVFRAGPHPGRWVGKGSPVGEGGGGELIG